jgi:hypothetical protein
LSFTLRFAAASRSGSPRRASSVQPAKSVHALLQHSQQYAT